jgi:hypothetical protein
MQQKYYKINLLHLIVAAQLRGGWPTQPKQGNIQITLFSLFLTNGPNKLESFNTPG